jgi:hypothetical protein
MEADIHAFPLKEQRGWDKSNYPRHKDDQFLCMSLIPLMISVQDFAFRGRPVSLLVANAPVGSHLSRFSRRSVRLALQSTAGKS